MSEHSNTCDLVGFRQGSHAPAVCSCGADPRPQRSSLENRVEAFLKAHQLWAEGDQVLVAELTTEGLRRLLLEFARDGGG